MRGWCIILGIISLCQGHDNHLGNLHSGQVNYWSSRRPRAAMRHIDRSAIEVVHVIQSNHLDLGFTGTFTNVVNSYFNRFIPAAIATGKALRASGGLPPPCDDAKSPNGFCRYRNHSCQAITCHPSRNSCSGTQHSGNETLAACQALCKASSCPCFEWTNAPGPTPFQGRHKSTNKRLITIRTTHGFGFEYITQMHYH